MQFYRLHGPVQRTMQACLQRCSASSPFPIGTQPSHSALGGDEASGDSQGGAEAGGAPLLAPEDSAGFEGLLNDCTVDGSAAAQLRWPQRRPISNGGAAAAVAQKQQAMAGGSGCQLLLACMHACCGTRGGPGQRVGWMSLIAPQPHYSRAWIAWRQCDGAVQA